MLVIPVIYMIMFKYIPMLGVVVAPKKFKFFRGIWDRPWVGLANFKEAFSSRDFWRALKNTLILNIGDLDGSKYAVMKHRGTENARHSQSSIAAFASHC